MNHKINKLWIEAGLHRDHPPAFQPKRRKLFTINVNQNQAASQLQSNYMQTPIKGSGG